MVYQIAISATDNRDKLNPPRPNRAVAHNKSGRGMYSNAGVVEGDKDWKPNTKTATSIVPAASTAASKYRATFTFRIKEIPFELQTTIAGATVSWANAFVQNRSSPSGQ